MAINQILRATGVAAAALALTASTAQAKPIGLVRKPANISNPLGAPSASQTSSSFDWTDAGVGAGAAAVLLGLTGIAGTRVRRRPPLAQP